MNEIISAQQLRLAAKDKVNESNMRSVLVALDRFGVDLGMNKPHILAQHGLPPIARPINAGRKGAKW